MKTFWDSQDNTPSTDQTIPNLVISEYNIIKEQIVISF